VCPSYGPKGQDSIAQGLASHRRSSGFSIGETKPWDIPALSEADGLLPQSLNLQRGEPKVELCLHRHRQEILEPAGRSSRPQGKAIDSFETRVWAEMKNAHSVTVDGEDYQLTLLLRSLLSLQFFDFKV
jgi:hypothetical protein